LTDRLTNSSAASSPNVVMQRMSYAMQELRSFYMQPAVQRAFPVFAAALLVVLGLTLYLVLQTPQRTTLFASLPEAEKAAVLDVLRNNGTDVLIDPVTGDLTVPTGEFYNSRMSLAAQGLPQSMPDGYSVLTDIPMGTSRSVESMRLKQSQEVELARSINEIDVVSASRVHLAIPERSAFARNAQNPTASVFVQVMPGRSLSKQQVMAIVNLVSSSVANLPKTSVTVVNQNGQLLSDTINDPATDLADTQLDYRLRLEDIYRTRVESLLTPIVGPGNVSVQVSLDIDFTRTERTEDMVVPDRTALLSEQEAFEEEMTGSQGGIPGSVANTPPPAPEMEQQTATPEGQASDAAGAGAEASGTGQSRLRSSNKLRNYEVSRTVMSENSPMTRINGVHVAVLLREVQPVVTGEDGEAQAAPAHGLDPSRIEEVKSLVSRTVGIDENRGDTLVVASLPFISPEAVISAMSVSTDLLWYEDPWIQEMLTNALMVLVLAVVSFGLIKPLLTQFLATTGESGYRNAINTLDGENIDMGVIEMEEGQTLEEIKAKLKPKKSTISAEMLDTANSYDDKVALIRMIVADEAGRVSNVFKALMEDDLD
jgi:flagellar M-ring protein FliF